MLYNGNKHEGKTFKKVQVSYDPDKRRAMGTHAV